MSLALAHPYFPPDGAHRAGGAETVTMQINSTQLALWSLDGRYVVEPGNFTVKVGTSDTTYLNATLVVTNS